MLLTHVQLQLLSAVLVGGHLSFYEPWAALACTVAVLAVMWTPLFRAADAPPSDTKNRQSAIDGLRGFSAFGVFLHHAAIFHDFEARGTWALPPSRFFSMAGQVGVSIFFLITGFLFWSKLLREHGRPNWLALYIGRVFRIGPVFSFAVLGITITTLFRNNWTIVESLPQLLIEIFHWLCLGMNSPMEINGDPNVGLYVAGVTWSLQYEWIFYASLLPLSMGILKPKLALPFTVLLSVCCLAWWRSGGPYWNGPYDPIFGILFTAGMVCACLVDINLLHRAPKWVLSAFALAMTITVFVFFPFGYGVAPALLLAFAFYSVVSGGDMIGLLRSRAVRRLGDISFGVYLLQGLVLTAVFQAEPVRSWALSSALTYWILIFISAIILVSISTTAHIFLERPGIRAGRQAITWISDSLSHRETK